MALVIREPGQGQAALVSTFGVMNHSTRNAVVIAVACLALSGLVAASIPSRQPHFGVQVSPSTKQVVVYDVRYFPTNHYRVLFAPFGAKLKLRLRLLLTKIGLPFQPVDGVSTSVQGPALVIYGRIDADDDKARQFDLVTDAGQFVDPACWVEDLIAPAGAQLLPGDRHIFLWVYSRQLTNGAYHVRQRGKTNVLATVRIRI